MHNVLVASGGMRNIGNGHSPADSVLRGSK